MTLVKPKVGFHTGPGGNPTGITSDFILPATASNVPVVIKSVDSMTGVFDLQSAASASGVLHFPLYRSSTAGQSDGYNYDVPDLSKKPEEVAVTHWVKSLSKVPPEFDRIRGWIEVINEPRARLNPGDTMWGNLSVEEWWGRFCLKICEQSLADGWKVSLFGWSSGEPEKSFWKHPRIQELLRLCASNPDKLAIALHEYSYTSQHIFSRKTESGFEGVPDLPFNQMYLVGRFRLLHEACDEVGIARPTIFITEFGWELNKLPPVGQGISQIHEVMKLYGRFPNIKGTALWYLGPGFGNIADQAQKYIQPVGQIAAETLYDVEIDQPSPPPGNGLPSVTRVSGTAPYRYSRRVLLWGNSVQLETSLQVLKALFRLGHRFSTAYSSDDAGIGNFVEGGQVKGLPRQVIGVMLSQNQMNHLLSNYSDVILYNIPSSELVMIIQGVLDILNGVKNPIEPPPVVNGNPPTVPVFPPPSRAGDLGPDVSGHNVAVDWKRMSRDYNVKFGLVRMSNGVLKNTTTSDANGIDRRYWENVSALSDLFLPFGCYHFLNKNFTPASQVAHILWILGETLSKGYFPVEGFWVDLEEGSYTDQASIISFFDQLDRDLSVTFPGIPVGIYTRTNWWEGVISNYDRFLKYDLWLAQWPWSGVPPSFPSKDYKIKLPKPWSLVNRQAKFWQWTSKGGSFVGRPDSFDLNFKMPYSGSTTTPPPSGKSYNIWEYMSGKLQNGQKGPLYELETKQNGESRGQERLQTIRDGEGRLYYAKGGDGVKPSQWEELRQIFNASTGKNQIERGTDTSHSESTAYDLQTAGQKWSLWALSNMVEGDSVFREPDILVYTKVGCNTVSFDRKVGSWLKFVKHHPTFPMYNEIVLNDVIQLRWSWSKDGQMLEEWFFTTDSRIKGMCGWTSNDGRVARVSEIHASGQRPDQILESICKP